MSGNPQAQAETVEERNKSKKSIDVLLKCLDHIFLYDGPRPNNVPRQSLGDGAKCKNVSTVSETAKTWKAGKATELMKRLGYVREETEQEDVIELQPPLKNKDTTSASTSSCQSQVKRVEPNLAPPKPNHQFKSTAKAFNVNNSFNPPRRFSPPRVLPNRNPNPVVAGRGLEVPPAIARSGNGSITHQGLFTQAGPTKVFQMNPPALVVQTPSTSYNNQATIPAHPAKAFTFSKPLRQPETEPDENPKVQAHPFRSAYELLALEDKARGVKRPLPPPGSANVPFSGLRKAPRLDSNDSGSNSAGKPEKKSDDDASDNPEVNELMLDERLKNVEAKMVEAILNEVVEVGANTSWDDIAGLQGVKAIIKEIIIWPMLRPDIFTGLRGPPKGILLFGPPGTGKTMIGRLIATQSASIFFNISASSLTSKWIGDGEKMVRALFQVARVKQPSVIFIDEIDSILTQRSDTEHESSRRLKTEFLIQFDGCGTKSEDKILVIGVTNRPQELDEAARRRLVKRIYIPLPDAEGRKQLVKNLVKDQNVSLEEADFEDIAEMSVGYSGADMASLCKEAAYGPIRDVGHDIQNIRASQVRPMLLKDFEGALKRVKASVASVDLGHYEDWDKQFGCHI